MIPPLIIMAIIVIVFYITLIQRNPVIEKYTPYITYMTSSVENKVYPNYKYWIMDVNPPNVNTEIIEYMSADENGYCSPCFTRAYFIKAIPDIGYWYSYVVNSYTDGLKSAAKYKIEKNLLPHTEHLNPFYYYFTFNNITGIVNDVQVYLEPSESTISKMSSEEAKSIKNMVEDINVSSNYPTLSDKNEYCFSFHPWQISHNVYNITVPHKIINYTIDDKNVCNISLDSIGNKITVLADCKVYTVDLCPSVNWKPSDPTHPWEGVPIDLYASLGKSYSDALKQPLDCVYPKVEICYN